MPPSDKPKATDTPDDESGDEVDGLDDEIDPKPPKPGDEAFITPKDVDRAVTFWERHCPPEFRGLISAQTDSDD